MKASEIYERQQRSKAFSETELGQLFNRAIRDTEAYWVLDSQENVSHRRLRERSDQMQASQEALAEKLMELAGV